MNEILQKRIEEAAKKTACPQCVCYDGGTCNCHYYCKLLDDFVSLMTFALQNQWIHVDEALPKDFEKVFFRAIGKNDSVCYGTGYINIDDWYTDIQHIEQDYFKFKITHWMPIPSLKGGEK